MRRGIAAFLAVLALLALTFRPVIEGDGVNYFVYLHSVVFDHDLDLGDEFRAAHEAGVPVFPDMVGARAPTGMAADFQPVGSALISLPFYLVAAAFRPDGEPQYGPPLSTAFLVASLLFGLLALALCYRLAAGVTGPGPAAVGVAGAAVATPYLFYLLRLRLDLVAGP
jgi:hypothetical protein